MVMQISYYIVAGNFEQYKRWLNDPNRNPMVKYLYLHSKDVIRGMQNVRGKLIGTWWMRNDITDILTYLHMANRDNSESCSQIIKANEIVMKWRLFNEMPR
jgi:hypothetical protein